MQTRREVRRFAYDGLLLRSARADQIADNDEPRCDANTSLEGRVGFRPADGSHQVQPRTNGSLRVILVGLWIPEVHQDPVAHVLGNEAAKALHGRSDTFLVGRNDLAKVFRVHARRQRR